MTEESGGNVVELLLRDTCILYLGYLQRDFLLYFLLHLLLF